MRREVPPSVFIIVLALVLGVAVFAFYRSGSRPSGAGVTKEELRREYVRRAQMGQLPITPEQKQRLLQGQPK